MNNFSGKLQNKRNDRPEEDNMQERSSSYIKKKIPLCRFHFMTYDELDCDLWWCNPRLVCYYAEI